MAEVSHAQKQSPVGPAHRRLGKVQMIAEKVAMSAMQSVLCPIKLRLPILRFFGAKIGRNVRIAQKVMIGQPTNLTISDGVGINIGSFIDCSAPVFIGERVRIGYGVIINTGSHMVSQSVYRRSSDDHIRRPVRIERGCWLQTRCMISPGVVVAEGCVVLAHAVITKSTTSNGEYAGLPAVRKRSLSVSDDETEVRAIGGIVEPFVAEGARKRSVAGR